MEKLLGIHHVTSITSSAQKIYNFFTKILGMRLVKKTVNQDDIQTYHLFFADDLGSPGTDMTFFDFPYAIKRKSGVNEYYKTSFRVPNDIALNYWLKRFQKLNVKHGKIKELFSKKTLTFYDFDGQKYQLISDEYNTGIAGGRPWKNGPVPLEYAITGLGPVFVQVENYEMTKEILQDVFCFQKIDEENELHLFETNHGGNGAQIIVKKTQDLPKAQQGYGSIHHIAFRVKDELHLNKWQQRLKKMRIPNSGPIDRFYFKSIYVRFLPDLLLEIATDGPGFMEDESYETLGEKLSLPPQLESKRHFIEKSIRPLNIE